VDALRGFAVLAILLVHNLEHFIFPVYPAETWGWLAQLDKIVFDVVFFLFSGKAYAIFALLFGFTFYIQNHNQEIRGKDFGGRFLWRLLLLAGFATLNAAFFPAGDVLLLFAVVGIVLVPVRRWSDTWIGVLAVLFLMQPIEMFNIFALAVNPQYEVPDLNVGAMYEAVAEVVESGNFVEFIKCNIGLGQKASFLWAVNAGRMTQTAGLFLLGFLIGRKRLFDSDMTDIRYWIYILVLSGFLFVPFYFISDMLKDSTDVVSMQLAVIFDMWQKLSFTFVLVSVFVIVYRKTAFGRHSHSLRLYGRMSLTNYISQSVIGAFIYFPFGLYLAPHCGYTLSMLIGIAIFIVQIIFCKQWLRHHRQGPLEKIWHRLTWIGGGDKVAPANAG